jgi:hypothetical protein
MVAGRFAEEAHVLGGGRAGTNGTLLTKLATTLAKLFRLSSESISAHRLAVNYLL